MTGLRGCIGLISGLLLVSAGCRGRQGAAFFAHGGETPAECRFDRTLSVSGNGLLKAHTGSGDLRVLAGDDGRVHISGHAKTTDWMGDGDRAEVQHVCDSPPITQTGAEVRVGRERDNWRHHVSVDYTIEVPHGYTVAADSGSGEVEIRGIGGAVTGATGSGDVIASGLSGGARLETGSGEIKADGLSGENRLHSSSGDIHAQLRGAGDVHAETASGSIQLNGVNGGLDAHSSSGNVEASGKPARAWNVETSSGDIRLHMASGSGFVLEADTASGDVHTAMPIAQSDSSEHHVRGTVGTGGPQVTAHAASGSVQVD